MSQISQIKKIYHAAIYVRLSKEDGAVASHEKTESNSIANQKSLIRDFLENKNDIEVVQEYVDDGFSGSNFERPAFQMMLEDIKKGKIDCVVTKDLSRFGREYIDSGMYIERLFPAMGVRFIAINDGIDSGEAKSQSDEIIIPFKNLINDAYCRDISIKIRSHLEIKRKQGDVITAFVPYGYKKNDKDKHKLEIDVYAANVVKDIFRMKLHGKSQDAIACELNSSGILPPAEYKASTGTTFERPEFDRMIHDIRAGKINTVITRDLSRLGRNYVEAGNYIERVFPFLDVRYIAITDDFDTARPGTDLSVPLKNIVNEYYSKDLSKKVETGKHSIWAQGGFSEGTPPYGYYRATDGSRKLLIDEEVSDNVVRIFNMFLDGKGYAGIAKTLQYEGILSPPKYRFYKSGKIELAEKAREWHYSHVKEILQGEYYIGNIVHGKQRKALDTGRKNVKTDASTWQRIENVHEPIIDKDTFYKTRERMEHIKKKHLEASKPKADVPNKPDNILVYKTKCACCGGSVLIGRHHTYSEKFYYKCKNRRKLARLCENKYSYDYSEVMDSVFSVIRQHMSLCVEKTKFVQKMNSRKENVLQYDIYTKQIAKLQNDVRRITANKSGLYEDYREQLITAEELCQYQREYESRVNEIEAQITELLHRRSLYEKEFHIDEGWEETVNKYMAKRKLTKELVDAFVSEIVFYDGNIEVKLLYDDFLKELLKVAEEREVSSNG
jgi:site-specific DNA recombinase